MAGSDADSLRVEMLERWERAAAGWGRRAERVRDWGMPVASWMIEHAALQPGLGVLELAAGTGETGFLAAELIRPGGTLICSDATEAMLEVARGRASELGIDNVEFKRIDLGWIDLETASVDRALCKWGLMLAIDPESALRETRRVLRPGGRVAVAVWDDPALNPWATLFTDALVELGNAEPPDPNVPGAFALAEPGRLQELLEAGGFVDPRVETVDLPRDFDDVEDYMDETNDLSTFFHEAWRRMSGEERAALTMKIAELAQPYTRSDGSLRLPARSLVATADA